MNKIVGTFGAAMLLSILVMQANAQKGEWNLGLHYNYSMPVGGFKSDIISHNSPRGFSGDLMYGINAKWSAGLFTGFQDYYQKYPRDLYQTGQHEVTSAVLSNSIQVVPVLFKVGYDPMGNNAFPVKPYVSVAAGVSLVNFSQYLGEFGGTTNDAAFTARAGAGILIPFGKLSNAGVNLGADYSYTPFKKYGYSDLNNVALHAGVYIPLR